MPMLREEKKEENPDMVDSDDESAWKDENKVEPKPISSNEKFRELFRELRTERRRRVLRSCLQKEVRSPGDIKNFLQFVDVNNFQFVLMFVCFSGSPHALFVFVPCAG